ncbi:ankyrin repeat and SAM domain-containing protein 1A-like isoform 3-T3 [Synchiropus picturatus]
MAVQARARHYIPPSPLVSEVIETKTSRPVSQAWSSMRRSAIDPLEMEADMHSLGGSTTWLLDHRDSNRRPVSTNSPRRSSFRTPSCELKGISRCVFQLVSREIER